MNFSIIINAYNPNLNCFKRLLDAVKGLDKSDIAFEVLIVDNNSIPALVTLPIVTELLLTHHCIKIINEIEPGLTAARMCGIKAAKYEWLIFFDDDNEPKFDYLTVLKQNIIKHQRVAAWGPGNIEVTYMNLHTPKWLDAYKYIFQEQYTDKTFFGNEVGSQDYYPYGTGLCVAKNVAIEYCKRVENNTYTLTDRKGKSTSSGGDLQLVLTATDLGFSVGKY
ncbi:MAG: glycosyltransferase family 2 protein [Ferruginibacter sp.]